MSDAPKDGARSETDRSEPMSTGESWLELRAALEGALVLFDRLGSFAHGEECDAYNACENGESDECYFDEEKDERVHNHHSCDCLVWDAAQKAKDIRTVLDRTMPCRPTTQHTGHTCDYPIVNDDEKLDMKYDLRCAACIAMRIAAHGPLLDLGPRRESARPVNTCAYITDWTLDDNGNRKTAEVCGAPAEWVHDAGVLACSEHYHEHTFSDRTRFSYIDEANAPPMFCEFEACDQEPAPGSTLCAGHIEENRRIAAHCASAAEPDKHGPKEEP